MPDLVLPLTASLVATMHVVLKWTSMYKISVSLAMAQHFVTTHTGIAASTKHTGNMVNTVRISAYHFQTKTGKITEGSPKT